MPAYARRQVVDESVAGSYHLVRCVRREFLCGVDRYSDQNFDHQIPGKYGNGSKACSSNKRRDNEASYYLVEFTHG